MDQRPGYSSLATLSSVTTVVNPFHHRRLVDSDLLYMPEPDSEPSSPICVVPLHSAATTDPSSSNLDLLNSLHCIRCGEVVTGEPLPWDAYRAHIQKWTVPSADTAPSGESPPIVVIPNGLGLRRPVVSMRKCNLRPKTSIDALGAATPFRRGIVKGFSTADAVCGQCNAVNGWYLRRSSADEVDKLSFDKWNTVLPAEPDRGRKKLNEAEQSNRLGSLALFADEIVHPSGEGLIAREELEVDRPEGYWSAYFTTELSPVGLEDVEEYSMGRVQPADLRRLQKAAAMRVFEMKKRREEALAFSLQGGQSEGGSPKSGEVVEDLRVEEPRIEGPRRVSAPAPEVIIPKPPPKAELSPQRSRTLAEGSLLVVPPSGEAGGAEASGDGNPKRRFSRQFTIPRIYMTSRGVIEARTCNSGRSPHPKSGKKKTISTTQTGSMRAPRGSAVGRAIGLPTLAETCHMLNNSERGWRPQPTEGPTLQRKALKPICHVVAGRRQSASGNKTLSGAINSALPSDLTVLAPPGNSRAEHIWSTPPGSRGSVTAARASRLIGSGIGSRLMGGGGLPRPSALEAVLGAKMEERRRSLMMAAAAVLKDKDNPNGSRRWSTVMVRPEMAGTQEKDRRASQ